MFIEYFLNKIKNKNRIKNPGVRYINNKLSLKLFKQLSLKIKRIKYLVHRVIHELPNLIILWQDSVTHILPYNKFLKKS